MMRTALIGVVVLVIGINTSLGVIVSALAGATGPVTLLQVLFFGGIVLNFAGFGILTYLIVSDRHQTDGKTR